MLLAIRCIVNIENRKQRNYYSVILAYTCSISRGFMCNEIKQMLQQFLQAVVGLLQHARKYTNDGFIAANHVAHRGHVKVR